MQIEVTLLALYGHIDRDNVDVGDRIAEVMVVPGELGNYFQGGLDQQLTYNYSAKTTAGGVLRGPSR